MTIAIACMVGWGGACRGTPPPPRPNVLLLTLDATRADALGCYDSEFANTPNLDALAGESLLFRDAVASTPYTGPAHASILTGLNPPQHGLRDYLAQALPQSADTLAERFREAGYDTAAFVSAYVLAPRYKLDQGFDVYSCQEWRPEAAPHGEMQRRLASMFFQRPADDTVSEALQWLGSRDASRPFFAWLHFYDPHAPFAPPEAYQRPDPPGRKLDPVERKRRLYYDEVTFMDAEIGRLLRVLDEMGIYESLVVAVVADHGELLGHYGRRIPGHSPELAEATLRIPLLLRAPGRAQPGEVEAQVRGLDLFPTLLEAAGLDVPSGIEGRSLFEAAGEDEPRPAYSETFYEHYPQRASEGEELVSLRYGGFKLVLRPGRQELFDLGADPGERQNIYAENPERVKHLHRELRSLAARWPVERRSASLELSEEETRDHLERLRALGYVE
jgi:choline-sulfatase